MTQLLREVRTLEAFYIFSGAWLLGFALFLLWSMSSPETHTPGGVAGFLSGLAQFFLMIILLVSATFLLIAHGIIRRKNWARKLGLVLSGLAVSLMLLSGPVLLGSITGVVKYSLDHPDLRSYLMVAFAASFPVLPIANMLSVYYLTRPRVKAYLSN